MKYMLVFFPFVGIAIGAAVCGWAWFCHWFAVNRGCFVLIGAALPLLISGGIHLDGYMDTMDALHSYKERKEKLNILQDAHIGAFSVITLAGYYLLYLGAYYAVEGKQAVLLLGMGFWLSRILSGMGVISLPCAKEEGLAKQFGDMAAGNKVKCWLGVQFLLCGAGMLWISRAAGAGILAAAVLLYFWYGRKCRREFGGVTGDTSGYFTTLCEGILILVIAACTTMQWI